MERAACGRIQGGGVLADDKKVCGTLAALAGEYPLSFKLTPIIDFFFLDGYFFTRCL